MLTATAVSATAIFLRLRRSVVYYLATFWFITNFLGSFMLAGPRRISVA